MDNLAEFEELNSLRSVPYDTYFGEMGIPQVDKELRKEMASEFEDLFLLLFELFNYDRSADVLTQTLTDEYLQIVRRFHSTDFYIREYAKNISAEIVQTTFNHIEEPYYTSYDRARFDAENESNTVLNHFDYTDAVEDGKTRKTWNTMLDERVRPTHWMVEGETIPIDEPFAVGSSLLMYPKDQSLGADASELVGCRCWCTYS